LRRDLLAAREKNGVYMAQENYEQITREIELQRKEIVEKLEQIKAMEEEQTRKEESCQQLQGLYDEQQTVLHVSVNLFLPPHVFFFKFKFQSEIDF
jgi:kinesin family protein 11